MIYFDNAATGGFKPRAVTDTATTVMRYLSANPGRSGHRLSLSGAQIIYECRDFLAKVFGTKPEKVIFTKNCTEALNVAIFGSIKKGGHVITTVFEHNSVLRPLYHLKRQGIIELDVVAPSVNEPIELAIKKAIKPQTYLIVTTALSNVTGQSLPIKKIGEIARKHGLLYLVDGAQGGGHIPLNLIKQHVNLLCLAGHKGLMGIMGSGALIIDDDTDISPLILGGTGSESFNLSQPDCYPERLEAGTLNLPAIASLLEGVKIVNDNLENYGTHLLDYTTKLIDGLSNIKGCKSYSSPNKAGIVSFELEGIASADLADLLNKEYDVAVRGGLHCAPLMHKYLGTEENGLLRASLSVQNSGREIDYFLKAISRIATN